MKRTLLPGIRADVGAYATKGLASHGKARRWRLGDENNGMVKVVVISGC